MSVISQEVPKFPVFHIGLLISYEPSPSRSQGLQSVWDVNYLEASQLAFSCCTDAS